MKQRECIRTEVAYGRNFPGGRCLRQNVSNEAQVTHVVLLRRQAERTELRTGLERAQINCTDEILVRRQPLQEVVNNAEELFRQGSPRQAPVAFIPLTDFAQFLLEKIERKVFFRLKIIEQRAFRYF